MAKWLSKLWAWLTSPFRRKPKHVPSAMEVAFEKALREMSGLPKNIQT